MAEDEVVLPADEDEVPEVAAPVEEAKPRGDKTPASTGENYAGVDANTPVRAAR